VQQNDTKERAIFQCCQLDCDIGAESRHFNAATMNQVKCRYTRIPANRNNGSAPFTGIEGLEG